MDFSLSSSLVGSAVSNPDKLALDLQFAADKTLTARKGPTPAFTRGSSGTFVGSNGLIQSAGNDVARFDHDPVTLACKGLLIEESRTNLVFPSAALTTQAQTVTAVAHTLSFYGTGTVVLSGAAIATVVGSGVYPTRTTLTFIPTAGGLTLTVTGTVQFAQLEAGRFATSYIPTTTASVIRSADVCSISGSDFSGFYNSLEGSLFTSVIFNTPTSSATGQLVVDINDTTTTNRLRYFRNPTTGISGFANTSGSTTNVSLAGAVLQPFVMQKFSAGFKLNDYAFYVNNSQAGVDNLGALLVSPTTLTIGDASAGAARQYLNGTISSLRYYKKRLPNEKLQALTA